LGRLDPKKGLENLLEACRILNLQRAQGVAHRYSDWSLVIAGTGTQDYTEALRTRIGELDLGQRVHMVGQVQDECKENLFAESDMLVVPSHTENFANVVVEALSRGVPVLASTGTPWKRLDDFGCGCWVENSPESLAATIFQMSTMNLHEMGECGRNWMNDQFAWPVITERMITLYRESLVPNALSKRDSLASRC
jgi:glycosyltransferase involved in cell wall biosynthesis